MIQTRRIEQPRALRVLLLCGAAALAAPTAMAQTPIVTIFQHCDFGGWQANFTTTGSFNTAALQAAGGINNDASSIKVAPGFKVTLFDGNNQTGNSIVVTANDNCFVADNFNDVLSSLKIEAVAAAAPVQLFQHCNFGGWQANFDVGSFNTAAIVAKGGVNNDASSIKIAPGFKVTLFDGDNQTGNSIVLTANDSCFVADNFNDVLSSMKVEKVNSGCVDNTIVSCGNGPDANGTTVQFLQVHSNSCVPIKVCVSAPFWNGDANARAAIPLFFDYIDGLVPELKTVFGGFAPATTKPFLVEIKSPFGGAATGVDTSLGSDVGDTITGDAYANTAHNVKGFFGFLLTLHEFINVWTGAFSPGWPTDWWADHRSPFPNAMDEEIMRDIGTKTNNPTLLAAADAQRAVFRPGGDQPDAEVPMFTGFFDRFGGFNAYNRMMHLVQADGLQWDTVATPNGGANPSPVRTEYVIAYAQMGFQTTTDLTKSDFIAAGVSKDDMHGDPGYTITTADIEAVANAHCSIASAKNAGRSVTTQLNNLRNGNFRAALVPNAACGATCPSECGCNNNQCSALWRAAP
jgi:hypothetical protein